MAVLNFLYRSLFAFCKDGYFFHRSTILQLQIPMRENGEMVLMDITKETKIQTFISLLLIVIRFSIEKEQKKFQKWKLYLFIYKTAIIFKNVNELIEFIISRKLHIILHYKGQYPFLNMSEGHRTICSSSSVFVSPLVKL